MARFRRMARLRPVQSLKHIVDISQSLAANTQLNLTLIKAVDSPALANTSEVQQGAAVNAIYLKFEVQSNQDTSPGAIPNFYMVIQKNPGNNVSNINPAATGSSDLKRFVIHQEMIMFENTGKGGNPRVVFQGVLKIPRGYRRFGYNDQLVCIIKAPALITVSCLQCIYKEYR